MKKWSVGVLDLKEKKRVLFHYSITPDVVSYIEYYLRFPPPFYLFYVELVIRDRFDS